MKVLPVILVLFAISFSTHSNAADSDGINRMGNQSCGEWVKYRTGKQNIFDLRNSALLVGYLSGAAIYSGLDILKTVDMESLYLWMDKYCKKNPLSTTYDGADILFEELKKRTR